MKRVKREESPPSIPRQKRAQIDKKIDKNDNSRVNLEPSGSLYADSAPLKRSVYCEPSDAAIPGRNWRLYVFKGEDCIDTVFLHGKSCFSVGRDPQSDIRAEHPSCSKAHAVIQFRRIHRQDEQGNFRFKTIPYLMDTESSNGTLLNGSRIDSARYYQLLENDCIKFGTSTRDYILLHENSSKKSTSSS